MENLTSSAKYFLLLTACIFICACSNTQQNNKLLLIDNKACKSASEKLQKLADSDQADRKLPTNKYTTKTFNDIIKHDQKRREQVAKIFADGCFKTANDYANAAIIFQHGTHADHFYQTYIWSKKAAALGDNKQKILIADAVDRYLVHSGYKQIFGTQAELRDIENPNSCFCLEPIEQSFPQTIRGQYFDRSIDDAFNWIKELNQGKHCSVKECSNPLKPVNKELLNQLGLTF